MKLSARFAPVLCAAAFFAVLCACGPKYPVMPISTAPPHESAAPEETVPARETEAAAAPTAAPTSIPTPAPTPVPTPSAAPDSDELVRVSDYIPGIYIELRYATENNFTGEVIYDFDEAYLRYGTVLKLARAQEALSELGFSLKIWDAFRPVEAQFTLWSVCPNSAYVANPYTGCSSHSLGSTVDATLVAADGSEIPMPTDFDDFSLLADRDYSDVSAVAAENAKTLENAMTAAGFDPYYNEWWHFSDAAGYSVYQGELPE